MIKYRNSELYQYKDWRKSLKSHYGWVKYGFAYRVGMNRWSRKRQTLLGSSNSRIGALVRKKTKRTFSIRKKH